jgi:hypothetical protein
MSNLHPHGPDGFAVLRCDGCGGEDVSCFAKHGVEHWDCFKGDQRVPHFVCGRFRYVGPTPPPTPGKAPTR